MSEDKRNINSKFSDFEPGIDEARIDKGWEKIKYFLPEEKKRRGLIFFRFPGLAAGLAALAILGVSAITFFYSPGKQNKSTKTLAVKNVAEEVRERSINKKQDFSKNRNGKISDNTKKGSQVFSEKQIPEVQRITNASAPINSKGNSEGAGDPEFVAKDLKPMKYQKNNVGENTLVENSRKEPLLQAVQTLTVSTPTVLPEESWMDLPLQTLALPVPERADSVSVFLMEIKRTGLAGKSTRKKPMLEVVVGPAFSKTNVYEINKNYNTTGPSAGLGFIYPFKNKWNFNGHFIFNQNNFKYNEERSENKVISRSPYATLGSSLAIPDSIITYREVSTRKTLDPKFSYFINLGLGYGLVQKNRFAIEASLQLSIKSSKYKFTSNVVEGTNTFAFYKTATSGPLPNEVLVPDEPYKKNYTKTDLGFIPALIISYKLTDKLAVIFKPAYFTQYSRKALKAEDDLLKFKQNNMFFHFGIRIDLK